MDTKPSEVPLKEEQPPAVTTVVEKSPELHLYVVNIKKEDEDNSTQTYLDMAKFPREMWWRIFDNLDHANLKILRAVHPFIDEALLDYKRFYELSKIQFKLKSEKYFDELAEARYTWAEIGLEIVNGIFSKPVPNKFYDNYAHRLTSLSLLNCVVTVEDGFFLSSIVDRSINLVSLEIGGWTDSFPNFSNEPAKIFWPTIKKLTLRSKPLLNEIANYILSRVDNLEELNVIGEPNSAPGTRRLVKAIDSEQVKVWTEEAVFIMDTIMPFVKEMRLTLRSLNLSNHFYLARGTKFIEDLGSTFQQSADIFVDAFVPNPELVINPILSNLDLAMCAVDENQLSQIMLKIPTLRKLNCILKPSRRCRHDRIRTEDPFYKKPLGPKTVGLLEDLNISYSVSLDCLCFVGQMRKLKHLDVSYCPRLFWKQTLLNGTGPAFGTKITENHKAFKKTGECVVWKLKTFKFVGNRQAKLDIRKFIFFNLNYLDLSYSGCITDNKDFVHICQNFRKLQVLKLSGTTAEFRLNRLKSLKSLTELRLRECSGIPPAQFENIKLEFLTTLDVAATRLTLAGFKSITTLNRKLVNLDIRSCNDIQPVPGEYLNSVKHIAIKMGVLEPKSNAQKDSKEKNVDVKFDVDTIENIPDQPIQKENVEKTEMTQDILTPKIENIQNVEKIIQRKQDVE